MTARRLGALVTLALVGMPAAALAQVFDPAALHAVVDVRAAAASGETSFTEEGFGKLRYGGGANAGGFSTAQLALAAVEWTPQLDWQWSAVVDAGYQPGQENVVDLYQAYLSFKPTPRFGTRFRARIGYFYPPISLENDARVWGVTDTITPSAINTWVGEEAKVAGGEATLSHDFSDQTLSATLGLFGFDETSGTLLAFRGWALHDIQGQLEGSFDLPPLSPKLATLQYDETYSTREIDGRVGVYGQIEWRPAAPVAISALYYDNNGDRTAVTPDLQWAWSTQFGEVGLQAQPNPHIRVTAEALTGRTAIGAAATPLADVSFTSAFVLASRDLGADTLSARLDAFETRDNAPKPPTSLGEHGWSVLGAWRHPLAAHLDLRLEALHVVSTRPSRILAAEDPYQAQTEVQSSLRFSF
ncbi:MAG TPA: hypothetical protein VGL58_13105 [Caulobacteraceae bacterium]|jgi:hypothetical protein